MEYGYYLASRPRDDDGGRAEPVFYYGPGGYQDCDFGRLRAAEIQCLIFNGMRGGCSRNEGSHLVLQHPLYIGWSISLNAGTAMKRV